MRFYFDEHVSGSVVRGLENREHNVLTMQDADRDGRKDIEQLRFADEDARVIVTADQDFLRLDAEEEHSGIIFISDRDASVGEKIRNISKIGERISQEEMRNHVEFI